MLVCTMPHPPAAGSRAAGAARGSARWMHPARETPERDPGRKLPTACIYSWRYWNHARPRPSASTHGVAGWPRPRCGGEAGSGGWCSFSNNPCPPAASCLAALPAAASARDSGARRFLQQSGCAKQVRSRAIPTHVRVLIRWSFPSLHCHAMPCQAHACRRLPPASRCAAPPPARRLAARHRRCRGSAATGCVV